MKETRFFYVPNINETTSLPEEEAKHAVRVLRMKAGDEMMIMDGMGTYYRAEITRASSHECLFCIKEALPQKKQWEGHKHIVMAPTKMIERVEWMLEKVTEIGINEISLIDCTNSERHIVKPARLEKIIISAMKQSHKSWKPALNDMTSFDKFMCMERKGQKYIAHCYDEIPRTYLFDELKKHDAGEDITILIGPEGDFSKSEVETAISYGFQSVHLGESRLRTETAAIVATTMMHLAI